ncbi:MAG: YHS domain-containing (seleno)protein [Arenicella sp.]
MKFVATKFSSFFSVIILSLFVSQLSFAAEEPVSTGRFNNNAIGKHDVLAYHESKQAVKGKKTYVHTWKGADWYFASEAHRDLFAATPEKFSPAYNGFCSNALSLGKGLVRTNGKIWHIWNDQLHTFYAEPGKQRWLENDYDQMLADADREWKKELAKLNK